MPEVNDEVYVDGDSVACDGGGVLGHPLVYLAMEDGRVECPYCSRRFVQRPDGQDPGDLMSETLDESKPAGPRATS